MLGYFGKVFVRKQHQSLAENGTFTYKGLFKNLFSARNFLLLVLTRSI